MITPYHPDDPAVRLLALQLSAKRTEQAALGALGAALEEPRCLVLPFWQAWQGARGAERAAHLSVRRYTKRTIVQMVGRRVAK